MYRCSAPLQKSSCTLNCKNIPLIFLQAFSKGPAAIYNSGCALGKEFIWGTRHWIWIDINSWRLKMPLRSTKTGAYPGSGNRWSSCPAPRWVQPVHQPTFVVPTLPWSHLCKNPFSKLSSKQFEPKETSWNTSHCWKWDKETQEPLKKLLTTKVGTIWTTKKVVRIELKVSNKYPGVQADINKWLNNEWGERVKSLMKKLNLCRHSALLEGQCLLLKCGLHIKSSLQSTMWKCGWRKSNFTSASLAKYHLSQVIKVFINKW